MTRRAWLGGVSALALAVSGNGTLAQETRQNLLQYNNNNITANGQGLITGPIINSMNGQIINGAAFQNDVNNFTRPNTHSGPETFNGVTTIPGQCPNIEQFLGSTLLADNTPAWNAALAAQSSRACVKFGPGTYKFASSAVATVVALGSVAVQGQGTDVTELHFTGGGNGVEIDLSDWSSSESVSNLSITTTSISAGYGLYLKGLSGFVANQNAQSNNINVTIRGADGYAQAEYWARGVEAYGVRWINFTNVQVEGGGGCTSVSGGCFATNGAGGFIFEGTSSLIPAQFNLVNCSANYLGTAINYGDYTQGVIVTNGSFVGDSYGIYNNNLAPDQLTVTGSNFNVAVQAISINSAMPGVSISGNYFLVSGNNVINSGNGAAVLIAGNSTFSIQGNVIQGLNTGPSSNSGVVVTAGSTGGGVITGNQERNLSTGNVLQAGSGNINVQANSYLGNTTNVSNSAASVCPATSSGNCVGGGSS